MISKACGYKHLHCGGKGKEGCRAKQPFQAIRVRVAHKVWSVVAEKTAHRSSATGQSHKLTDYGVYAPPFQGTVLHNRLHTWNPQCISFTNGDPRAFGWCTFAAKEKKKRFMYGKQ